MKTLIPIAIAAMMYYGHVENRHGTFGRIGILYNPVNHEVVKVYAASPAAKAGIHKHDIVRYINDTDIAGPAYTLINLTIKRGDQILVFVVERVPAEEIDVRHEVK